MIDAKNAYYDVATSTPEGTLNPKNVKLVGLEPTTSAKRGPKKDGDYIARVTIEKGEWPVNDAGIDIPDHYMQFEIPGSFVVKKISMILGSGGTGNINWSVYYSTDEDFTNPTPIVKNDHSEVDGKRANGSYKTVDTGDEALDLSVEEGQTLYIRIYPAYITTKGETNFGRCLMIDDVTVEGVTN